MIPKFIIYSLGGGGIAASAALGGFSLSQANLSLFNDKNLKDENRKLNVELKKTIEENKELNKKLKNEYLNREHWGILLSNDIDQLEEKINKLENPLETLKKYINHRRCIKAISLGNKLYNAQEIECPPIWK